jgi:DNA-binding NarL/FixJ family response regulator
MNGIDLVSHISSTYPGLPCLMLSGHGENSYVRRALQAGARGYVLKDDSVELPTAMLTVLDGEIYLSKSVRGTSQLHRHRPRQRE